MRVSRKLPENPLHDLARLPENLVIPEAQHAVSPCAQEEIAGLIDTRPFHMLSAIDLDNQLPLEACKIDYERADRKLAPELHLERTPRAKQAPEAAFRVC